MLGQLIGICSREVQLGFQVDLFPMFGGTAKLISRAVDLGIIVDTGFLVPTQTLASASIEKLTRELSMDLPCLDSKTLLKLGVYE